MSEVPDRPEDSERVIASLLDSQREFLAFLERRLGDRALSEDILQEAFARGLSKLGDLREGGSARAWFYRLLRNAIVDHARRRSSESERLARFAAELSAEAEDEETAGQVCQCVSRVAGTLKPEYADAVQRIEIEGMSVKTFAEGAGITANNAAVRVFRAREDLKKRLLRACGACAEHGCLDCSCGKVEARGAAGEHDVEARAGAGEHDVEARAGAGERDVEARAGAGEHDVEAREQEPSAQ